MGACNSVPLDDNDQGSGKDREVGREIRGAYEQRKKVHKLLLLGPGNSGKSTFFKQLTQIHGDGFTQDDKVHAIQYIYDAILDQMKHIILSAREEFEHVLAEEVDQSAQFMEKLPRDVRISKEIAEHVKTLWACELIRDTFENRTNLGIVDSSPYFFENIDRIAERDYLPTEQDILLARIPTTGIREASFAVDEDVFEVYDVGGQRSERSKWIHCFDGVHAVMFVVSLSCYDQKLYEDSEINAMEEGMELWEEVVNSHYFANKRTSMIIFFNKSDLFQAKIQRKSIRVCWPHYEGEDGNEAQAHAFILDQFLALVEKNPNIPAGEEDERQIYHHVTCATDQDNVKRVFNDVQHGVVVRALADNGII